MNKKKGFTIVELVIALMLIAAISMILTPVLFNNTDNQILLTSLNKNYTMLQEIHQAIPMLQARGRIPQNNNINNQTFMTAVALTQKAIGLNSDGTSEDNNKFKHALNGYTTTPAKIINNYTDFNLPDNPARTTIILKNGVFISQCQINGNNYIMIDTNGIKSPNKTGRDIFFFSVTNFKCCLNLMST